MSTKSTYADNGKNIEFKKYENGRYVLDRNTVNRLTRWLSKS